MRTSPTGTCNGDRTLYGATNKGFTIFELILVVFLMSLLLALSFPSFSSWGEKEIKSDAKRLASILRYLHDDAVTTKETSLLKVNIKEKSLRYKIHKAEKSEVFAALAGVEIQSKGSVSEGEVFIFFGPAGASEAIDFLLRQGGEELRVSLHPLSGRVEIRVGP